MSIVKNHYTAEFQTFQKNGATKSPSRVNDVRKAALTVFEEQGFPTTKDEDWKYTNVAPIAKQPFTYSAGNQSVSAELVKSLLVNDLEQYVIVFVNGHFSKEHSQLNGLQTGVVIKNLIDAYSTHDDVIQQHLSKYVKYQKNSFTALNTAFINDGAFIHVLANIEVEKPIHLLFINH